MFKIVKKQIQYGNHILELETGKIARQATASVVAKMAGTVVLCTVVADKKAKEDIDFFPLTVNYIEKFYASGRIPGGFNKRESRPTERETLISRLIDRPIRPLFPQGFFNEVQVVCTVISYDPECQPDVVAFAGVSAALAISGIPFEGPVAAARVGFKEGEYVLNPSAAAVAEGGLLDLMVAGTSTAVLMVESEAKELSEEVMLGAVKFGQASYKGIIKAISEMAKEVGNAAWEVKLRDHSELRKKIKKIAEKNIAIAYDEQEKQKRVEKLQLIKLEIEEKLVKDEPDFVLNKREIDSVFKDLQKDVVRGKIIKHRKRIDGRGEADVRQILSEIDLLPCAHGSALFTRGETQALVVVTLGTGEDEQMVDNIEGNSKERFLLHYNFPPYSVGEVGRMGAPGRREIGHGKLAFRAINPLLPTKEEFPYTMRVVSEITESNGSSSMATVCGTSLALMASGVPLKSPIAGIAMGLIKEGKDFVVLSDILGDEDYLGDMDFKVAGTDKGITALQMDIKITGITEEIMEQALDQAKTGRLHILGRMSDSISQARATVANTAPQITTINIPKDKIGEVIGPGGKMIKSIIERTQVKMDISDTGAVNIASTSLEKMQMAIDIVNEIVCGAEIGKTYTGKVIKMLDFGVVVAFMNNMEGLVHISEMASFRIPSPQSFVEDGAQVTIKVLDKDRTGKLKLSMKGLNVELEAAAKIKGESSNEEGDQGDSSSVKSSERSNEVKSERPIRDREPRTGRNARHNNGPKREPRSEPRKDETKIEPEQTTERSDNREDRQTSAPASKKRRFF